MAVTIDGENLLVILEPGLVDYSVQVDLYSDWKEWMLLSDNAKYPQMFRTIGGDPISGLLDAGDYYFFQNVLGWRIRPAEESLVVTLTGNLYTEDPNQEWLVTTIGDFNTSVRLETSSLTQGVTNIDREVWNYSTNELVNIDSYGQLVQDISVGNSTIDGKLDTIDGKIDAIDLVVNNIDTTTTNIDAKTDLIQLDVTNILDVVNDIIKYHANRTFINKNNFTLTVYEADNSTPFKVFDLKDDNGVATITSIFERLPQ